MQTGSRKVLLIASVGLIVVGIAALALGGLLQLASFLAIDPEDEVPIAMWFTPFVIGAVSIVLGVFGVAFSPRKPKPAPSARW